MKVVLSMKEINIEQWSRQSTYECFSNYDHPVFSVATSLDVTELVNYSKERNTSFFTDFLYIVCLTLNQMTQFRYRIVDDKVVEYDVIHPSFVVMNDLMSIVTCHSKASCNYSEFYQNNREAIVSAKHNKRDFTSPLSNNVFYISCLPWIDFVSMSNPYNFADKEQTSIPRITWGKYTLKDGRYKMTMDISAHHALMDGYHISVAFSSIQDYLDNIRNIIN